MKLTKLFKEFLNSEQASGVFLILATFISLVLANSMWREGFLEFWHTPIGVETHNIVLRLSLEHWINEGLMAIFFLLIGLEIEREIYIGELSDFKNAALPILAALGGMLIPALFYLLFNWGTTTQNGMGIPMATDIAFALGILALLGNRIPASLKVFLAALAIVDDLGAILIIAIFYVGDFSFLYLTLAVGVFVGLLVLNRSGVRSLIWYLLPGLFLWYFLWRSGLHATLAGVLLAFAIPFGDGGEESPSYKLQHALHKPVAFFIMPLFALANTGLALSGNWLKNLALPNSLGVFAGLFLGKPLGISLASLLGVRLGLAQLPGDLTWRHIVGAGFLGGIGFTMSIFITSLAFENLEVISSTKLGIFLGSLIAGIVGSFILRARTSPG